MRPGIIGRLTVKGWVISFLASGVVPAFGGTGGLPGDCDNNGVVDLVDFAGFTLAADVIGCAGPVACHCYDLDDDGCVDLHDFGALQTAFGTTQDTSGPPPSNIFVRQLEDYHQRCPLGDGGDGVCHVGDPCCQTAGGPNGASCDLGALKTSWVQVCDMNADGERDLTANLDTLAEWNDFFWEPEDACNTLAREQYPPVPADNYFARHFFPMCTDGTTPPKGTTVCPDAQPIIQCTDGTRPLFYYDAGTTDRWIIKVQNGGDTCMENCWRDEKRAAFSSAWGKNVASRNFTGLYKPFLDGPFSSYNRLIIDKCVGDRNCGSNTITGAEQFDDQGVSHGTADVYFHGYRELQALLKYLTVWDGGNRLTPNSQILIAGHSNGSNGMYMYIDRLAEYIRHDPSDGQPGLGLTNADVRGLAASYVRPSVEAENLIHDPSQNIYAWQDYATSAFDDHIIAPMSTAEPETADGLWYSSLVYFDGVEFKWSRNWGALTFNNGVASSVDDVVGVATLDESCFREHGLNGGTGDNIEACLDSMHVLMNHVTTPLFLSPQLYDPNIKALPRFTKISSAFFDLGYVPDPGSVCSSHDENFVCVDAAQCPDGVMPCTTAKGLNYDIQDFAMRVRGMARAVTGQSPGMPEESPADVGAPVTHAVFAPEWEAHESWELPKKMDYQICDGPGTTVCAWQSAPLWAALKSWLEYDATVICVEQDDPGVDPDRPLTAWSETTPGPLLDNRCGMPPG